MGGPLHCRSRMILAVAPAYGHPCKDCIVTRRLDRRVHGRTVSARALWIRRSSRRMTTKVISHKAKGTGPPASRDGSGGKPAARLLKPLPLRKGHPFAFGLSGPLPRWRRGLAPTRISRSQDPRHTPPRHAALTDSVLLRLMLNWTWPVIAPAEPALSKMKDARLVAPCQH